MEPDSNNPKQILVERLQKSTNILVTVSRNPTVDQLAACLGLTLWLNKMGKHATAVFSGEVPSTLEFLQPEATLEKNTNSLRDFIISLDKSKADKLRYKVEDQIVKIFITPYRTSLSVDDLEFSQGDFNVDMVVALAVNAQEDLDAAVTAHGRILHDATVATITNDTTSELGSISWHDQQASSLSEIIVDLGNALDRSQLDGQIATSLLTGIVSATARFSNQKTTPQTMSISAELLSSGANQQLVADELAATRPAEGASDNDAPKPGNGTIEIAHSGETTEPAAPDQPDAPVTSLPEPVSPTQEEPSSSMIRDVKATNQNDGLDAVAAPPQPPVAAAPPKFVTEPPMLGGTLTANSRPEDGLADISSDPLSRVADAKEPILARSDETPAPDSPAEQPASPAWMPAQPWMQNTAPATPNEPAEPQLDATGKTLTEIEQAVASPHVQRPDLDAARDEVMNAVNSAPNPTLEPIQALNAQPLDLPIEHDDKPAPATAPPLPSNPNEPVDPGLTVPAEQPFTMPLPSAPPAAPPAPVPNVVAPTSPNAPPPVPPPLMPPGFPGAS